MNKFCIHSIYLSSFIFLSACGGGGGGSQNGNQTSVTQLNHNDDKADIVSAVPDPIYSNTYADEKIKVFQLLNNYRARCGFGKVAQNTALDQAAQSHADYLGSNPDPVYFSHKQQAGLAGFTGVEPSDRWSAAGYQWSGGTEMLAVLQWGTAVANNKNSTLTSEIEIAATAHLKSLLASPYHLVSAMSLNRDIGIGITNRKIQDQLNFKPLDVTFATAAKIKPQRLAQTDLLTFPCDGTTELEPAFGVEQPDPFPDANRLNAPYGHPIYVMGAPGVTLTLDAAASSINMRHTTAALATRMLSTSNDPSRSLQGHQIFLVPTARLADNATYDVTLAGTSSRVVNNDKVTTPWSRTFSFTTGVHKGV